ncbi:hypothetical protein C2E23DRAFT_855333 [Lenzites betulinus]|nr:hypothetical protein C2E23DRAFT_855333 [Lenzites betulinus]
MARIYLKEEDSVSIFSLLGIDPESAVASAFVMLCLVIWYHCRRLNISLKFRRFLSLDRGLPPHEVRVTFDYTFSSSAAIRALETTHLDYIPPTPLIRTSGIVPLILQAFDRQDASSHSQEQTIDAHDPELYTLDHRSTPISSIRSGNASMSTPVKLRASPGRSISYNTGSRYNEVYLSSSPHARSGVDGKISHEARLSSPGGFSPSTPPPSDGLVGHTLAQSTGISRAYPGTSHAASSHHFVDTPPKSPRRKLGMFSVIVALMAVIFGSGMFSTTSLLAGFQSRRAINALKTEDATFNAKYKHRDGGIVELVGTSHGKWKAQHIRPAGLGPVEHIDVDARTGRLAICVGSAVELLLPLDGLSDTLWEVIPNQKYTDGNTGGDETTFSPRGVHFIDHGQAVLIAYLNHGIRYCRPLKLLGYSWRAIHLGYISKNRVYMSDISSRGRSALSSDGRVIAVSNLHDGFDLYNVVDRTHLVTIKTKLDVNVPLPMAFIEGHTMLMGTTCGKALWGDTSNIKRLLAYGTSEKGSDTTVVVWRASPAEKPATPEGGRGVKASCQEHRSLPAKVARSRMHYTIQLIVWFGLMLMVMMPLVSWTYFVLRTDECWGWLVRLTSMIYADAESFMESAAYGFQRAAIGVYDGFIRLYDEYDRLLSYFMPA